MQHKNKYTRFTAGMLLTALCVTTVTVLSYSSSVSAQPGNQPPLGNVNANFYTVKAHNNDSVPSNSAGSFVNDDQVSGLGLFSSGFKGIVAVTNSLGVNGIGGEFHGNNAGVIGLTSSVSGRGGIFNNITAGTSVQLGGPTEALFALGDVEFDGHLRTESIGKYVTTPAGITSTITSGNSGTSIAACPSNYYTLISCGYKLCSSSSQPCNDPGAGTYKIAPNKIVIDDANNQCIVGVHNYDSSTRYIMAQARCFNPNL